MSDQLSLFGQSVSLLQIGIFVAGLAVGISSSWFAFPRAPETPNPVAPSAQATSQPPSKEKPVEEEEEDEEDEEYDDDGELLSEDEKDPENVPHKLVRLHSHISIVISLAIYHANMPLSASHCSYRSENGPWKSGSPMWPCDSRCLQIYSEGES